MEINGVDRVCLRNSGSSIDVSSRSWINENDLLGEHGGEADNLVISAFEGEGGKCLAKVNGVEFKEEQRKCTDLKPLWDKALTGIDKEFRVIRVKLVRVAKTKRGEEEDFGKRNMPGKRARRHFSQLSEFERGLIIGMKTAGWSTRRVAGQVDRSECAVRSCWEQWTREGTHARKTGRPTRKTTRREDRRIVRQALVDPTVTRSTIRAGVGVAFVPQTISRHLAEANLKSKRPFRALPITPDHRQLRLQWCLARSMWNVTDWQKVVFSDESRFLLGTDDDNRVRVWRCAGKFPHTVLRHSA
ncbi:transposable element Tc1 transposase [Trichonephila clavipes]|nr:transposable element Tc1 transposase [Trichonephila clavipes]